VHPRFRCFGSVFHEKRLELKSLKGQTKAEETPRRVKKYNTNLKIRIAVLRNSRPPRMHPGCTDPFLKVPFLRLLFVMMIIFPLRTAFIEVMIRGLGRIVAVYYILIHFIPDFLTYLVPLFLKRQCDRTLGHELCAYPPQAPAGRYEGRAAILPRLFCMDNPYGSALPRSLAPISSPSPRRQDDTENFDFAELMGTLDTRGEEEENNDPISILYI
jgi:hypothetical protein